MAIHKSGFVAVQNSSRIGRQATKKKTEISFLVTHVVCYFCGRAYIMKLVHVSASPQASDRTQHVGLQALLVPLNNPLQSLLLQFGAC